MIDLYPIQWGVDTLKYPQAFHCTEKLIINAKTDEPMTCAMSMEVYFTFTFFSEPGSFD